VISMKGHRGRPARPGLGRGVQPDTGPAPAVDVVAGRRQGAAPPGAGVARGQVGGTAGDAGAQAGRGASVTSRPDWDSYFLAIAAVVATRADCSRRQVGAVVVAGRRIVSCGYNGAPAGQPGCLSGACPRGLSGLPHGAPGSEACIAIHAEMNCLLFAGMRSRGADLYITDEPCANCRKHALGAGIARIITPFATVTL